MTLDILFLAKNRYEFTRQSLGALEANTNWDLVRCMLIVDDGSTDGTLQYCVEWATEHQKLRPGEQRGRHCVVATYFKGGSPAEIMNEFGAMCGSEGFCKIDSDTIVPPGWLDSCLSVMEACPELDLLGIEPPASRVPHFANRPALQITAPEHREMAKNINSRYAECDSIGGIGLMRTRCFRENRPLRPTCTYSGFTGWQLENKQVKKGWICPPLRVFLLDRLPMEPWTKLSAEYEAKGWQRPWQKYPESSKDQLWGWWKPV